MADPECNRAFLEEVFHYFPYTDEARSWLRRSIRFEVENLNTIRNGGGWWQPEENRVYLHTAQYEAAIHELAHAWWHYRRQPIAAEFIGAVQRLADEVDEQYSRLQGLAHGYIYGISEQGWPGMLVDNNDWEMYAGLASGCMADVRLLPRYVGRYYEGLSASLPGGAPEPVTVAPHR